VASDRKALVAVEMPDVPFIRVVLAAIRDDGPRGVAVENDAWEALALHHSSPVIILPVD
jgi:hypothetical protein